MSQTETLPSSTAESGVLEQARNLEREASRLREQNQIDKAFELYDRAAEIYQEAGDDLQAALCFASAATCWNIHTGWRPLNQAATRSRFAAEAAEKAGHFDYSRSLFHDAALLFEKEGDSEAYSYCFMSSQRVHGKAAFDEFLKGCHEDGSCLGRRARVRALIYWLGNRVSNLVWGYGEKPFRVFGTALASIFIFGFIYAGSGLVLPAGGRFVTSLADSLYFSAVTFSTVGYGDFLPHGWVKLAAVLEGLLGITLTPLFVVALTRRYLRMYR